MTYKEACKHSTESYGTIYMLTNEVNGKKYVGQTVQKLALRLKAHKWHGKQAIPKTAIHWAIKKHGFENFIFEVLGTYETQTALDTAELYFANEYKTFAPDGYNLAAGVGVGSVSEITRQKIIAGLTGRIPTQETRDRISAAKTEWYEQVDPEVESLRRLRLSEAKAGTYILRSPTGERVEVTNLKQWCADNDFTRTQWCKLALVVVGKDRSVKGWSLWNDPGQQPLGKFRAIGYTLCSPTGEKVFVSTTLKEWCVAQGFTDAGWAAMRKVTSGAGKKYQGWAVWKD